MVKYACESGDQITRLIMNNMQLDMHSEKQISINIASIIIRCQKCINQFCWSRNVFDWEIKIPRCVHKNISKILSIKWQKFPVHMQNFICLSKASGRVSWPKAQKYFQEKN